MCAFGSKPSSGETGFCSLSLEVASAILLIESRLRPMSCAVLRAVCALQLKAVKDLQEYEDLECVLCQQQPKEVVNFFDLKLHLNAHLHPCNNSAEKGWCADAFLQQACRAQWQARRAPQVAKAGLDQELEGPEDARAIMPQNEEAAAPEEVTGAVQDNILEVEEASLNSLMNSLDKAEDKPEEKEEEEMEEEMEQEEEVEGLLRQEEEVEQLLQQEEGVEQLLQQEEGVEDRANVDVEMHPREEV